MGFAAHGLETEFLMFSLKFDLLFPSLDMAKAMAKRLNQPFKRPDIPIEPRELKRMHDELRLAREQVRAQVVAGRLFP
jgi:hypothetical protein